MRYILNERGGIPRKALIADQYQTKRLEIYVQRTRPECKLGTLFITIGRWVEKKKETNG